MKKFKGLSFLSVLLAVGLGVMILRFPQSALDGVRYGIELSLNVAVPSLFPFLAVSVFVSGFAVPDKLQRVLSVVMRFLFRLPGEAFCAVVFGLVGGYPVGCAVASRLYEQGKVTREQAQRLTLFCVNSGPAFAVTAVGSVMLGDSRAGALIFASLCLSSVFVGVALRFVSPEPQKNETRENPLVPLSYRFVESAEKASLSVFRICAWITLFSCLFSLLKELGLSDNVMSVIRCVFEVTGGCRSAAEYGNIYTVAATLGWSGLCVVCQVLGDVRKVGTPLPLFLAFRAVHAALAAVVCRVLLMLFPVSVSTFAPLSPDTAVELFSASAPAAIALLGLCTVFIVDLDRNKKMC